MSDLIVRSVIAGLLLVCASAIAADRAVVLMYHRFAEDTYPSTSIRLDQFKAHLEHLRDHGYHVVPLADLLAMLLEGADLPDRTVVITVDDAYRSVYDVAHAELRAHGFPYTVFVSSDPVDEGLQAYMTWDQMRELQADGVTFANHGAAHGSTIEVKDGESTDERLVRVRADVENGWRRLAEELNPLAGAFAYPYGEYDAAAADLIRELGYVSFGQHSGAVGATSDTRALARFPMAERFGDMDQFRTKVASMPMPIDSITPWNPLVSTGMPHIDVVLGESDARLGDLACFVGGQGPVEVEWLLERRRFRVSPVEPLGAGRQRVNCTAPGSDGRYVWFSHPWFVRPD